MYLAMHIYIEDMRTKKALSERSGFCSNREYIVISCPHYVDSVGIRIL